MKKHIIGLVLVCMAGYGFAGTFEFSAFTGMITDENAALIAPTFSPDMENCEPSPTGVSLDRRQGTTYKFSVSGATSGFKFMSVFQNAATNQMLLGYNNSLVAVNQDTYTQSVIYTSTHTILQWNAATLRNNKYFANGYDEIFYYDGASTTTVSAAPRAQHIVMFNDTCFVANWPGSGAYVRYSVFGDPTDWTLGILPTQGDSFAVADRGNKIVALAATTNGVLVLGSNSIYKIVGTQNPYQVIELTTSLGCKSAGSVVSDLSAVYFLGSDGHMYVYDGSYFTDLMKDTIADTFQNTAVAFSSSTVANDMTAMRAEGRLYFGVMASTASTKNDKIYVLDPRIQEVNFSWWKYGGIYSGAMGQWDTSYYVASSTSSCVYKMFDGSTDNGTPISAYYYTSQVAPDSIFNTTSFQSVTFVTKRIGSTAVTLDYYLNSSATSAGQFTVNPQSTLLFQVQHMKFPEQTNGTVIQFKIANISGSDFSILAIGGQSKPFPILYQNVQ